MMFVEMDDARCHHVTRHAFQTAGRVLVLFLCLLALSAARGQLSHTAQEQGVNVTLTYNKTHVEVGEPVLLKMTLENATREPIFAVGSAALWARRMDIFCSHACARAVVASPGAPES